MKTYAYFCKLAMSLEFDRSEGSDSSYMVSCFCSKLLKFLLFLREDL